MIGALPAMKKNEITFFDRKTDYSVVERRLPHWCQAGTLCFVTWRLADSLPSAIIQQLEQDIEGVLAESNLSIHDDWKSELKRQSESAREAVHWKLFAIRDKYLDAGHGCCLLRKPQYAEEVIKSLRHFDEERYFLTDAVVMPNHCHFICAFRSEETMLKQCVEWKRFTARRINSMEGIKGEFWQFDQFDHLIRNEDQFERFRRYIQENPLTAGLVRGEYAYYQKDM